MIVWCTRAGTRCADRVGIRCTFASPAVRPALDHHATYPDSISGAAAIGPRSLRAAIGIMQFDENSVAQAYERRHQLTRSGSASAMLRGCGTGAWC